MSLGSYVHREAALRASPDASVGPGGSFAVETLLGLMRSSERYAPLGLFVPWAERAGKGQTAWMTTAPADHDLLLYPLTDEAIAYVNTQSFGHELPWVGVLTKRPVDPAAADTAFDRSRYDLASTEGIYRADSGRVTPRIYFLHTATLHPDVGGGRESLQAVAKKLGGTLVFPLQIQAAPRRAPPLPFTVVLDAQTAPPPADLDVQASPPPAAANGIGADGSPSLTLGQSVFWAGTMAAVGYMFWRTAYPRRARTR